MTQETYEMWSQVQHKLFKKDKEEEIKFTEGENKLTEEEKHLVQQKEINGIEKDSSKEGKIETPKEDQALNSTLESAEKEPNKDVPKEILNEEEKKSEEVSIKDNFEEDPSIEMDIESRPSTLKLSSLGQRKLMDIFENF
eukprot:CAMPEP_0205805506 /NCGR_PEP_ID=MMETSP0205-20121125/8761_1 /ASSEMBLY_ACC=CAM_ASM_000278 /TAXON_ID=36767 /ORGANISM="Euplotes focardii, Strain TN1" /LENGTH=139 /DNA_ID=CAMNT_0053076855 /DNA_START=312 /DNA_END=731 /DNA_ORIENTATION=+